MKDEKDINLYQFYKKVFKFLKVYKTWTVTTHTQN